MTVRRHSSPTPKYSSRVNTPVSGTLCDRNRDLGWAPTHVNFTPRDNELRSSLRRQTSRKTQTEVGTTSVGSSSRQSSTGGREERVSESISTRVRTSTPRKRLTSVGRLRARPLSVSGYRRLSDGPGCTDIPSVHPGVPTSPVPFLERGSPSFQEWVVRHSTGRGYVPVRFCTSVFLRRRRTHPGTESRPSERTHVAR